MQALIELGSKFGQGYLFSRPLAPRIFAQTFFGTGGVVAKTPSSDWIQGVATLASSMSVPVPACPGSRLRFCSPR